MQAKRCVIRAERDVVLETFDLEDRAPRADEILLESRYTLVSPGTETANYSGLDENVHRPGAWCAYPWVAGYTAVGRVLKAGSTRFGYKEGDLVLAGAPHASHSWVHTRNNISAPLPAGADLKRAPYVRLAGISKTAVDVSSVRAGDRVLVVGMGTIGNLAAQLFREHGAKVVGADPSARRRTMAEDCGLDAVDSAPEETLLARVTEALGGPPRIVVEAVGEAALAMQCVGYAGKAASGEVILLGSPRRSTPMDARDIFGAIHVSGIKVIGAHEGVLGKGGAWGERPPVDANLKLLGPWVQEGRVRVEPLISHVLPPAKLQDGYEGLLTKKEEYVGVLLDWQGA